VVVVKSGVGPDAQQRELWFVPIASGQPRKLDIAVDNWILGNGNYRLSPDGRRIAFVTDLGRRGREVWALEDVLPGGRR
jgi:hypothetical protein